MTGARRVRIGVLVSGRGSNLQAILDASAAGHLSADVVVVLSDVADAYALERARRHNVPALFEDPKRHGSREAFDKTLIGHLEDHRVELVCLAGFMRVMTSTFVAHYRNRIMNIHPALLPAFPGLHVQGKALKHGVKFSGCTVHFVDEGVDTGPIIIQAVVPVLDGDTEESLSARILRYEHQVYPRAIQLYAEGRLKVEGRRVLCAPAPGDGAPPEFGGLNP